MRQFKMTIAGLLLMLPFAVMNAHASSLQIVGPATVTVGDSFDLSIIGDFGSDGLLAGGLQLIYDPVLVQIDNVAVPLPIDPSLSCPGAGLCPVDPAGTLSLVWGQFLMDLIPAGAGPTEMATLTLSALDDGVAPFTMIDFSAFTGGWFGAGFVNIATPEFLGTSVSIVDGPPVDPPVDPPVGVPEPGTLALFVLGLVGMVARRRKTV